MKTGKPITHGVPMYPIGPCDCEMLPCGGVRLRVGQCREHQVTMSFHQAGDERCTALAAGAVGAPRIEGPPCPGQAREMTVWGVGGPVRAVVQPDRD